MGSSVTQRILSFQLSRRLTIAIAGLVLLGAIAGSAARPPEASAQCIFCSQWGYNYGRYWPWGYNSFNNFNYGYNYGFNYGWPGLYGYNNYGYNNYGYNNGLYGYNNCNLGGGYFGGFGNCGGYNYGSNYGLYGYNNYAYSNPVYYNAGTTYATTSTVPATVVSTYSASPVYAISGMYCKDKSGGAIWEPTGAPPDPTLTCGGTTATTGGTGAATGTGGTGGSGPAYP